MAGLLSGSTIPREPGWCFKKPEYPAFPLVTRRDGAVGNPARTRSDASGTGGSRSRAPAVVTDVGEVCRLLGRLRIVAKSPDRVIRSGSLSGGTSLRAERSWRRLGFGALHEHKARARSWGTVGT
jgi:hypothetical protein